jgi:hypothetical protein
MLKVLAGEIISSSLALSGYQKNISTTGFLVNVQRHYIVFVDMVN